MHKFLTAVLLAGIILPCFAAENRTIKVTPARTITTARKNSLGEGDYVDFKVTEGTKSVPAGDTVTGVVTSIEDNGFAGKEAQVLIENFKHNGEPVSGEIYLHGNIHKKLNEFVDSSFSGFPVLVRGGEVVARPNEQVFLLYTKD